MNDTCADELKMTMSADVFLLRKRINATAKIFRTNAPALE
jgi:hypothetical protein